MSTGYRNHRFARRRMDERLQTLVSFLAYFLVSKRHGLTVTFTSGSLHRHRVTHFPTRTFPTLTVWLLLTTSFIIYWQPLFNRCFLFFVISRSHTNEESRFSIDNNKSITEGGGIPRQLSDVNWSAQVEVLGQQARET